MWFVLLQFLICSFCQAQFRPNITSPQDLIDSPFLTLFNRNVPDGVRLHDSMNNIQENYIKGLPLKVVTHGWLRNLNVPDVMRIVQAYLKHQDNNIIALDWRRSALPPYTTSAISTQRVGNYLGDRLVEMVNTGVTTVKDMHLIGHSLGGQVMGFAGQRVQEKLGVKVARITGLDAAGPEFLNRPPERRLDASDADFVDGIHTSPIFGFLPAYADVDFYPNNPRRSQPGCGPPPVGSVCSHQRAYKYFAESIEDPEAFVATKCDSYNNFEAGRCAGNETTLMGDRVSHEARGTYYLFTDPNRPFDLDL